MPSPRSRPGPPPRPAADDPGQWVIRRRTVVLAGAAFGLLALWASAATWFIVFHDAALAQFMARQSAMQYAYEEKVSALRARLDRVATQKLLEQDGVETRVAELASRQMALENRQAMLLGLAEQAGEGVSAHDPAPLPAAPPKPAPLPTPGSLGLRSEAADPAPRPGALSLPLRVAELEAALDAAAARQSLTLDRILQRSQGEAARLRRLVADLGLDPHRFAASRPAGIGGPLVPVGSGAFETALMMAQRTMSERDELRRVVKALPLWRPTQLDAGVSSPFGYRVDPFTRGLALHTGVDLKAEYGAPVRAAGAGRVVSAEYAGGYGNMVEIDHGHGLATRYGHLSAFAVAPGQVVEPGQVIGRVGSTGRSTAPHLHYETRIDGEPVDPQRFLRASALAFAGGGSAGPDGGAWSRIR
ncbi:peptidase M23B [Methylobacterium sp. 4-46]|uniref:M23 family metallopeptidase n=1 Tax=unclassified Methylobacterium TaxID=2615210 RepID=UPI000152DF59|nr:MULTISPECIES: M23 family metallopeptidase [Methylobacterium]ACA20133.1 peptidase M23B [Methylobacterium sp. 4-46]WFT79313.1 M23 family metallopeptidase [Methylobacterium nodulans]